MAKESKDTKCAICLGKLSFGSRGYWNVGPGEVDMHVGCAEKTTEVFKVQAVGYGSFYFDIDAPIIEDIMDGSDIDEGYTITKAEMTALEYFGLPEFTGF